MTPDEPLPGPTPALTIADQSEQLLRLLSALDDAHVRQVLVEETLRVMYAWGRNGVVVGGA